MLSPGTELELTIEKAAAGGRMIARHEGLVVLVAGAIPGERVVARAERVERKVAFAAVTEIVEPSRDRRAAFPDPLCGGCLYSHIAYPRQLQLKADIVAEAFARIGRLPVSGPIAVMPSPEQGYRMRARLHARDGRAGFFREASHTLCDPGPTGQLTPAALRSIQDTVRRLGAAGVDVTAVELTENITGEARVAAVALGGAAAIRSGLLDDIVGRTALDGLIARDDHGREFSAGAREVSDPLSRLTLGRAASGELHRHPEAFFQANRFLVPHLVDAVIASVNGDGPVLDLYAGVGLFAVSLAAIGYAELAAVEGNRASGLDLQRNAGRFGDRIRVVLESVEAALARWREPVHTIVLDPPRTGVSPEALSGAAKLRAERMVYVSCDPATLARDARILAAAGYALESLRAFDFFPNTPHVESLAIFGRSGTAGV